MLHTLFDIFRVLVHRLYRGHERQKGYKFRRRAIRIVEIIGR